MYVQSTLLVWPEDYRLGDDFMSVVGGEFVIRPGSSIKVGGGSYEALSDLPSQVVGGPPSCSGPYFWISHTIEVK